MVEAQHLRVFVVDLLAFSDKLGRLRIARNRQRSMRIGVEDRDQIGRRCATWLRKVSEGTNPGSVCPRLWRNPS